MNLLSLPFLTGVATLCALAAGILNRSASAVSGDPRPNVVMILLDDQDERTSPMWDALPKTASLLRDRGLNFTNAFAPTPICCPARSTILTGLCAHNTGVLTNAGPYGGWWAFTHPLDVLGFRMRDAENQLVNNEERTIAVHLNRAGYRTALMGKYLNGYVARPDEEGVIVVPAIPPGWSEFYGATDNEIYTGYNYRLNEFREDDDDFPKVVSYGNDEKDYLTDVLRDKAVDFVGRATEGNAKQKPFFLMITPTAPHLPMPAARRHAKLAKRWVGKLPHRKNFNESDISDKPTWLRKTAFQRSAILRSRTVLDASQDFANRMGSLYAVDDLVDAVVQQLKHANVWENTVVIFTSDNGYNLGSHRLIQKMAPYEESIRVPLVAVGPGIRPGNSEPIILESDFFPTFLEMAKAPVPEYVDGFSFLSLLQGSTGSYEERSSFLVQYKGGDAGSHTTGPMQELPKGLSSLINVYVDIPSYRALRTKDHTFVEWYEGDTHEYELYDLRTDPFQMQNRFVSTSPPKASLVIELERRLKELSECKGAGCR